MALAGRQAEIPPVPGTSRAAGAAGRWVQRWGAGARAAVHLGGVFNLQSLVPVPFYCCQITRHPHRFTALLPGCKEQISDQIAATLELCTCL